MIFWGFLAIFGGVCAAERGPWSVQAYENGSYTLELGGEVEFFGGDIRLAGWSRDAGNLTLSQFSKVADGYSWIASNTQVEANMSIFLPDGDYVAFVVDWVRFSGVTGPVTSGVMSSWPSLFSGESLGQVFYDGISCDWMVGHGDFPKGTDGMTVIVPEVSEGQSDWAVTIGGWERAEIVSMVAEDTVVFGKGVLALAGGVRASFAPTVTGGLRSSVLVTASLRRGATTYSFDPPTSLLMPRGGVNAALYVWGEVALTLAGKQRGYRPNKDIDLSIGYSSTAFFFYNPCDCTDNVPQGERRNCSVGHSGIPSSPNCISYADTLEAVFSWFDDNPTVVPRPKHLLIDSWWYGEGVEGGGAFEWEDSEYLMNFVGSFPNSLKTFSQKIQVPIWAHNGYWIPSSPYFDPSNNLTDTYPHVEGATMPQGPLLWNHLFGANKDDFGLTLLKQDHVSTQIEKTPTASKNLSQVRNWYDGINDAGLSFGVGLMYCCTPATVMMTSLSARAGTHTRGGPDYVPAGSRVLPHSQWAIGPNSAFHFGALGLVPYKDTLFTNSTITPKNPNAPFYGYKEEAPWTHWFVAILSGGPVTTSDSVGSINATLVNMGCDTSGRILGARRPLTAIDAEFQAILQDKWPNSPPANDSELALTLQPCDSSDPRQHWTFGQSILQCQHVGPNNVDACVDVSGCNLQPGAAVHGFSCVDFGTCDAKNQRWDWNNGTFRNVESTLCLWAAPGQSFQTQGACDQPQAQWVWNGTQLRSMSTSQCLAVAEPPQTLKDLPPNGNLGEIYSAPTGFDVMTGTYLSNVSAIVLAVAVQPNVTISPADLGLDFVISESNATYYWFRWTYDSVSSVSISPFSSTSPIPIDPGTTYTDLRVYIIVPTLVPDFVLLGEAGKVTPISPDRITSATISDSSVQFQLRGAPNEFVRLESFVPSKNQVQSQQTTLSSSGVGTISFSRN